MPSLAAAGLALFERSLTTIDRIAAGMGRGARHPPHLSMGIRGEEAAFFYLRRQGYVITARAWRSHRHAGDIDLIGWDGDCLCFVEVKTRTSRKVASAEAAVDDRKRRTLRRMARHYMRQIPTPTAIRFDVLSIYFEPDRPPDFVLFQNAFGWSDSRRY